MEEQLKVTCLHDSHVALGAKMSPFAGFDMPIQYSSITEEHLAVRNNVGMFDVSHMGEIFVSGPDAEKFVNHIFTNDIRPMVPGQVLYGMMLYSDGGTVDDLLVYKEFTADHYLLVVNAANIEKDFLWIKDHAEGYDVKLVNDSDNWGQIALQGPKAEETLVKVLGFAADAASLSFYTFKDFEDAGMRVIISRTGYTGSVTLGGVPVEQLQRAQRLRALTLVPHNATIFKGTVESNLRMAKPDAAESELWSALEQVNLAGFCRSQNGLQTALHEGGSNLSGGQRQRLAMARALLHDTPIYLFDEATSNVDAESENDIMQAIRSLAGKKTVILISHRLANVVDSDCIYVMDGGRIAEQGKHEALLAAGGVYSRLYNAQKQLEDLGEVSA